MIFEQVEEMKIYSISSKVEIGTFGVESNQENCDRNTTYQHHPRIQREEE